MEILEGVKVLLDFEVFIFLVLGVLVGTMLGALPGLDSVIGVALLLPVTYALSPEQALVFFTALYSASVFGASITAILFRIPGTSEAVMTALEGYHFTARGEAGVALGIALCSSALGGLIACVGLFTATPLLAKVALQFGPAEYFALGVLGLSCISTVSGNDQLKGLSMALLGLLIGTIGLDAITSAKRFDFGVSTLLSGVPFIPASIGLFAASEVYRRVLQRDYVRVSEIAGSRRIRVELPRIRELVRLRWTILRSAVLGLFVGVLPGAGATTAAIIGYSAETRLAKDRRGFGTGKVEGLSAPEAANNAGAVGSMIPLLSLGIPGSATTAVLIGAFMVHNLQPGPLLFAQDPTLIYAIFSGMTITNVIILVLAFFLIQLFARLAYLPYPILATAILTVSVIGSLSFGDLNAVTIMLAFGFLGLLLQLGGFPLAPIVLGIVLSPIIEVSLRRALLMAGGSFGEVVSRPITSTLLTVAALIIVAPWAGAIGRKLGRGRSANATEP